MADDYSENDGNNRGCGFLITIIAGVGVGFLVLSNLGIFHHCGSGEKAMRISCASDLKQIGLALKQYAMDYDGQYPPYDNAKGLELLRKLDYLTDLNVYQCPTVKKRNSGGCRSQQRLTAPLKDEEIDYIFVGGLSESDSPDSPICWDKPGNHSNWGNVLFVDGHVKGYAGADWIKRTGRKPRND